MDLNGLVERARFAFHTRGSGLAGGGEPETETLPSAPRQRMLDPRWSIDVSL